jgi:hypothetical protein
MSGNSMAAPMDKPPRSLGIFLHVGISLSDVKQIIRAAKSAQLLDGLYSPAV